MKTKIDHTQNFIRFLIVLAWTILIGVGVTATKHVASAEYIGWPTALFYVALFAVAAYAVVFVTSSCWSKK